VPARFDDMLRRLTALPTDHPSRLDDDQADRLGQARPMVEAAAAALADGPVPATLQHGDLHPGNVFAVEGSLRIFDFGDAQWACALEALCTPRAVLRGGTIPWDAVQGAYLEAYEIDAPVSELDRLLGAAAITEAVNRSLTWWGAIAQADDAELADWGDGPARHLLRVLDQG
jgi:Ser/Thr protein kinase RdoA (MazF antagonist)